MKSPIGQRCPEKSPFSGFSIMRTKDNAPQDGLGNFYQAKIASEIGKNVVNALAISGGGIELLQFAMDFGRDADWTDFGVDLIAIVFGMLSAQAFNSVRKRA